MFKSSFLLILFAASSVYCNETSNCKQKEICESYLDSATDMIVRAKHNIPIWSKMHMLSKTTFNGTQIVDCADVLRMGYNKSGIYVVRPRNRVTEGRPLNVYCDMDTDGGGWTVIQRRGEFGSQKSKFAQYWESYKEGFGDLDKDFWLGNDNIFALTNQKLYSARFDLMDVEQNRAFAEYEKFWIDDEDKKYTLHLSTYRGNAGDSMTVEHNNQNFSTRDQDNDNHTEWNCARKFLSAWWYNDCNSVTANLNGLYEKGLRDDVYVKWGTWRGNQSLEWTEIKVRPRNFMRHSLHRKQLTHSSTQKK